MFVTADVKDRASIERQIALLVAQIKCIQCGPHGDPSGTAERCRLLYKAIASLERKLCPDSNALRNSA
jgi:hypothetical protein